MSQLRTREQLNKDFAYLRREFFDSEDQFMSAHQIKTIRTREREIPEWTLNDKEVKKVLLRAFPTLLVNAKVEKRALRWVAIIYFYFRRHLSARRVARQLKMTEKNVEQAVARIRRVGRGLRADNTGPRSVRRPGRPRKMQDDEKKAA